MASFTLKDIQGKGLLYPLEKGIPYRFTFPDILNSSFLTIEGDVSLEGEIQPILNIAGIGGNKGKEYGVVLPSGGNIFIFLPNVSSNVRIRGGGIQSFTLGNLYIEEFLVRVDNDGGVTESVECLESSIIDIGGENFNNASLVITPNAYKEGKLYSIKPFDGTGDFDVTRATTAWRRNSSGIWVEEAANVPRLHYPVGGGCPSVLVEPQRTNLLLRSQEFDDAYWTKFNSTIDSSVITSPIGFGDAIIDDSVNASHRVQRLFSVTSGVTYTQSVYFKKGVNTFGLLGTNNFSFWDFCFIDLNTLDTFLPAGVTAKVEVELNGWIRFSVTKTANTTGNFNFVFGSSPTTPSVSYIGAGDISIYLDGAQFEEGTEATSIIPTTSATVTRNADVIGGSGNSGTFNSEEGVLYAEISALSRDLTNSYISISDGSTSNAVRLGYQAASDSVQVRYYNGGVIEYDKTHILTNKTEVTKVAIKWKQDDFSFFVNGVLINNQLSGNVTSAGTLNQINFGFPTVSNQFRGHLKSLICFSTALSNAELETLTTL